MSVNNNIQDELSTWQRLTGPTPTYFRAIQIVAILLAGIGSVVYQLTDVGITLPIWLAVLGEKATLTVDAVLIVFPQLTVDYKALNKQNELENITR